MALDAPATSVPAVLGGPATPMPSSTTAVRKTNAWKHKAMNAVALLFVLNYINVREVLNSSLRTGLLTGASFLLMGVSNAVNDLQDAVDGPVEELEEDVMALEGRPWPTPGYRTLA